MRKFWHWLLVAVMVVVLDQATKWAILQHFVEGERQELLPVFNLTLLFNRGAAWSFLHDAGGWQQYIFGGLALVVSGVILRVLAKQPTLQWQNWALSLVLGGAIGNLIDRLVQGKVTDFIQVHWQNAYFPAFNVADAAITVGAILLILEALFIKKPATAGDTDR